MIRVTRIVLPILIGVLVAACQPASTTAADEAALRKVLVDIENTFNAGDYDSMLANYEDDVLVQPSTGTEIRSKDGWRDALKSLPPGVKLKMKFDTQELSVGGNLAFERGTYAIDAVDAAGVAQPVAGGRHVHIFRRDAKGIWKGWRLFELVDLAPPAVAVPASAPAQ